MYDRSRRTGTPDSTWYPPERPPWGPPGRPPAEPPGRQPGWRPPEWVPAVPAPPPVPQAPSIPATHLVPPGGDARTRWEELLLDRRIVPITGRLDAERASECAAKLLLLDARGAEPVTLRLDSPDADLTAIWTLADTLDELVVEVHALVVGELGGGSLVLLTAAAKREAHPHARFRLADPALAGMTGTASSVSGEAAAQQKLLDSFHSRLAEMTGRDQADLDADLRRGRFLTAPEAVEYGLVTAVTAKAVRNSRKPPGGIGR